MDAFFSVQIICLVLIAITLNGPLFTILFVIILYVYGTSFCDAFVYPYNIKIVISFLA